MPTHRKRAAELGLSAISIEGALIAPSEVARILAAPADQKTAADYGCPKGTTLKDEMARYFRIGQAHWQAFDRIEQPTVQQAALFARAQLEEVFGFEQLKGPVDRQQDGHRYRIAWEAKGGRVPIVCAAPMPGDDAFRRPLPEFGDGAGGPLARRTPMGLLQEWLNANADFLWGLVFAGDRLRLMRDNLSFTRPAWIEADFGAIYRDENFSEFTALWLLIHASRFGAEGAPASDCALERWREAGLRAGTAVRDRLRGSVEEALELLGQGFLDANPEIRERLASGQLSVTAWFEQLLRLVYRLIFLAVAEDRDLLHAPNAKPDAVALYADNYSFAWLRDRSARQSGRDHHQDAYEGTKIVFRALAQGEPLLGLPSLGGLFSQGLTPDLDDAKLENRAFLAAVFRLAWLMGPHGRERVNWRDMATEEFGSVYEGLLELVPVIEGGNRFAFAGGAEAKGNARKISGSYYTPDSLVQTLLDSALDPVLGRSEAEGGADGILDLKVIDPACGSGHFLLGAARRMANHVAQLRDPDAPDYQAAMRDVVRNCIYGVDRNPLAVELAKVALWIEAIEPGKPLGFLDANIRCGDSLLGVFDLKALEEGIPDDAYKPLTGDDKPNANGLRKLNKLEREAKLLRLAIAPDKLASRFEQLHDMPESTVEEVRAKERAYRKIHGDPDWWSLRQACDAYVAAFLLPKHKPQGSFTAPLVPTTRHVREALDRRPPQGSLAAAISDAAEEARPFHWPVEFPDIMIGRAGFDVVLGNPPWEVVQLSEKEYFATRAPAIAELNGAARKRAIGNLQTEEPELFTQFERAKRTFDAINEFARGSGRFPLTARGKINTYGLFAELFLSAIRKSGRAGVIVPTGIATDATTAPFFGYLVNAARLVSLFSFENEEFIFPGVHHSTRFALLTLGDARSGTEFAFFLRQVEGLQDLRRRFTLSSTQIAQINPNTKTAPIFRTQPDADLAAEIYSRVPVLIDENAGDNVNAWQIDFRQGLFNMTSDSGLFRTALELIAEGYVRDGTDFIAASVGARRILAAAGTSLSSATVGAQLAEMPPAVDRYVPLYEAKMIHQFDHRWATYEGEESRDSTSGEKADPAYEPSPRYWVPAAEVQSRLAEKRWSRSWLMSWRDVTSAHVFRTAIAAAFPAHGVGHKAPCFFIRDPQLAAVHLANWSTLVFDFIARQKVGGTALAYFIVYQLPVLPPHAYGEEDFAYIVPRVLELSYTSWSMQPFARDLGYDGPPFRWDEERRAQLRAELDAWYALAYGLSRENLRYILDPKDVRGVDYPSETFRVLQNNEMKKYGEYRTQRLVLAAYDKMIAEGARPRTEGWRQ